MNRDEIIEELYDMKVYVLIKWFYEGDGNLVNSFVGVKSTYEKAKSLLDKSDIILADNEFKTCDSIREPKGNMLWNRYGDGCRYEIRKVDCSISRT